MSSFDAEYEPSPWEPIVEQVEAYERTGGAEGGEMMGKPCIILWTIGAKSGKVRKTPLMRATDGTNYVVIGSQGGAPTNPQWVHNLRANPVARVQDGPNLAEFTVREVTGDEKAKWWKVATDVWPDFDEYQKKTERVIPAFVLEPKG